MDFVFKFHSVLTCDLDKLSLWACSLNLKWGQDINVLGEPRNSTKANFCCSTSCLYRTCGWCWGIVEGGSLQEPAAFCPSWCHPMPSPELFKIYIYFLLIYLRDKESTGRGKGRGISRLPTEARAWSPGPRAGLDPRILRSWPKPRAGI